MKYHSPTSSLMDTVTAPVILRDESPGTYTFETIDKDIVYFKTDLILKPGETDTVVIPVVLDYNTLTVHTLSLIHI